MPSYTLTQFREQLAQWIDLRITGGKLPYRRLETNATFVTTSGTQKADLLLWINRTSLQAGSIILVPENHESETLNKGIALANTLGVGHFVSWEARQVCIWGTREEVPQLMACIAIPAANQVQFFDFQRILDQLLGELKIITVKTAYTKEQFSPLYYLNLCRYALDDLMPDLIEQIRLAAGQDKTDLWIKQKPVEIAWMSLWRLLYLVWQGLLPPGLQPERLEKAIRYALSNMNNGPASVLRSNGNEALLSGKVAIRLHHLAGRLKQLNWPKTTEDAAMLFGLLSDELAKRMDLTIPPLHWDMGTPSIYVNCGPSKGSENSDIVAPSPYLAGLTLKHLAMGKPFPKKLPQHIYEMVCIGKDRTILAQVAGMHPPAKHDQHHWFVALRQSWPNRRFDLPRQTPVCLWEALHLTGLQKPAGELTLVMNAQWVDSAGSDVFWRTAQERYQLLHVTEKLDKQVLHLRGNHHHSQPTTVHRGEDLFEIDWNLLCGHSCQMLKIVLHSPLPVIQLLRENRLVPTGHELTEWGESLADGIWLFSRTSLGRQLWEICTSGSALPSRDDIVNLVCHYGVPLPSRSILGALGMFALQTGHELPPVSTLDGELSRLWSKKLELQQSDPSPKAPSLKVSSQRLDQDSINAIVTEVFRDGTPRFPESYLIHYYRPELCQFDLPGPLVKADRFFDQTLLLGPGSEPIEVSGKFMAEALFLASHCGRSQVKLPVDEDLCEELVTAFREDLAGLWQKLVRLCRNRFPERLKAIRLARKIWAQKDLPDPSVFE